jgi:hypothetical protein
MNLLRHQTLPFYSGKFDNLLKISDEKGRHSPYVSRLEYLKAAKEYGLVALALKIYDEKGKVEKPEKLFRDDYKKYENIWNLPDVSHFLFELFGDPETMLSNNTIPSLGEKYLYFLKLGGAIDDNIDKFSAYISSPDVNSLDVSMKDFLHLCLLTSWFKVSSPEKMSIICSDYTKTHLEIISSVIGNLGFEKIARFSLGQFPFEEGNEADESRLVDILNDIKEGLSAWSFLTSKLDKKRRDVYDEYRPFLVPSKEYPVLVEPKSFEKKKEVFYKALLIVANLVDENFDYKSPF